MSRLPKQGVAPARVTHRAKPQHGGQGITKSAAVSQDIDSEAQGPQNQPSHLSTADPRRQRPSSYITTSLDSEYVASLGLFIISTLAFYLTQDMHPPIHPRTNLPSSRWRP